MRLLKHKKGQTSSESAVEAEIGKQLIEIILALIIAFAAISYAYSVGSNLRIMEAKSARDLALAIETAEGSPGNVLFSYSDAFGFQYKFSANRVNVYLKNEPTDLNSLNYFLFPQDSQIAFIFPKEAIGPGQQTRTAVSLKKSFPQFSFGSDNLAFSASACEKIDTSKDPKRILVICSSEEEALKKTIQDNLIPLLKVSGETSYFESSADLKNAAAQSKNAIILEIAAAPQDSNVVISAIGERKSAALACIARNSLTQKGIIATTLVTSAEDSPNLMNPVSLKFEISQDLPYKDVIESISKSIQEYLK